MDQDQRAELAKIILTTSVYYNRQLSKDAVMLMIDDLADLDFDEVVAAYSAYRKDAKQAFFPLPSKIREMIFRTPSEEDVAKTIASKVTHAVSKFGWNNHKAAENYIGPIGWEIVKRKGGWLYICENLGLALEPGTFEAQVREIAKVEIVRHQNPRFAATLDALASGKSMNNMLQQKPLEEIEARRKTLLDQAKSLEGQTNE